MCTCGRRLRTMAGYCGGQTVVDGVFAYLGEMRA
jgi:hypothetical protein